MDYLFFDVEGANCYNYVLKMCTFGYVIIDEKYNVKSKIDVVMNPDSPFDRHIIRENMNAYPLSFYTTKPLFNYFYKSIKNLLEKHKYIIGWSIENDVKYIYDACKRYNLQQIEYSYLDMQKVYMDVYELKSQPNLESVCKQHDIQVDIIHKSDDDALLTMLITKVLCEHLNISIDELFEKYSHYISNVSEFASRQLSNSEIDKTEIYGFDVKVIDNYANDVRKIIKYIVDCGAKCSSNLQECTTLINIKKEKGSSKNKSIKTIDFHKFMKLIEQPVKNK